MERTIVTIPPGLLTHLNVNWDIDWRGQSSGDLNDGTTQTVFNAFPRWVGSPKVFLYREAIAQWQAIRDQAQGRVGIYRMRMLNPAAFSATNAFPTGVPFSNGQPFSTGYGFEYESIGYGMAAASAGATELQLSSEFGLPNVGQIMSHDDWPFRVTSVTDDGTSGDEQHATITLQMPLRKAIAADDPISLVGTGLFESAEEGMGNPAYGVDQISQISLSFREVLNR